MTDELKCTALVRVFSHTDNQGKDHYRDAKCNAPAHEYELTGQLAKAKAVLCGAHKYKADCEIAEHAMPKPTKHQKKLEAAGQQRLC